MGKSVLPLKSSFQNFTLLVSGNVFFLLRLVEEGEGEDGDGCCAPDVQEFSCRGTSIFAMGSSRKVSGCQGG